MNNQDNFQKAGDTGEAALRAEKASESWIEAILFVARHYRLDYSQENIRLSAAWSADRPFHQVLKSLARQVGLDCRIGKLDVAQLSPWKLPVVVQFQDGQVAVVKSINGDEVGIVYSGDEGLASSITRNELAENTVSSLTLRPFKSVRDSRVDDYIKPYDQNWFRKIILKDLRPYGHVLLASLTANVLALSGILFARQVYDRVIPAESLPTLYVLFSGVMVAMVFDFIMRNMRVRITDLLGKRADLQASDQVFGHALRIKNSEKPKSTGTFIAQIRELEHVRELMTSTTVTAFADMPFFFLFCLVLWYMAGPLVLVPMGALLLLLIPGLLVQRKLHGLANEAMRESSLRNAMLVESVQNLEDIKMLQAEQRFQQQWNHYNAVTADVNLKLRFIANSLGVWTQNLQNIVFASVVLFGAPMVMAGDLSIGSMVAASILASRMMAPMSQIASVMSRWQQAKVAMESLNQIMQCEVDDPESDKKIHRPAVFGNYHVKDAAFQYAGSKTVALQVKEINISKGERVAILGRNGAGKTTLLHALSGMMEPVSGEVTLDGVSLAHIDPADVRRDVGLLMQGSQLFHGTIRENLMLGAPNAPDDALLQTLEATGANEFIKNLPDGLDHMILEGGIGFSGGQRQSLLLSRLLLRDPRILLLDEPTASLDETTEKRFIQRISQWLDGRTLLVATHRMAILQLVQRIIVVDNGKVVLDDDKAKVLAFLSQEKVRPVKKKASKASKKGDV